MRGEAGDHKDRPYENTVDQLFKAFDRSHNKLLKTPQLPSGQLPIPKYLYNIRNGLGRLGNLGR
jgi:hypothetical protein